MDNENILVPHEKETTPVENTEVNTPEVVEEEKKFDPNDYKVVMNLIKEVDESYNVMKESVYSQLSSRGLKNSILETVLPYSKDDITAMDEEKAASIISGEISNSCESSEFTAVENLLFAKNLAVLLTASKMEAEKVKLESQNVLTEYFNYISSDRVREAREKRLASLKEAVENETNEILRKKMEKMIATIENSMSFAFLQDRFDKYGEKEVFSIKDGFFKENHGSYIVGRYLKKVEKFGYKANIYTSFYNIEENFLPEEYSPFNNLFLFIYMRLIAFGDPYSQEDKMLIQALTSAIANLIYHRFDSIESEKYFISVIEKVDSHFMSLLEEFKENNYTYEKHPSRMAAEAEHEAHRKEALIKSLHRLNVEEIDENLTADELQVIYNNTAEDLILKQQEENKVGNSDENSNVADESDLDETD